MSVKVLGGGKSRLPNCLKMIGFRFSFLGIYTDRREHVSTGYPE